MAKEGNSSKVSVSAWNASLKDIDERFKRIEKRLNNKKETISIAAWDSMLKDFNERFNRIEEKLNKLSDKVDSKVSVNAWNKVNEEFNDKFKSKVSVSAWEKSLEDLDNSFKSLALTELKKLDSRLDKISDLINEVSSHLNEKVSVNAWEQLSDNVNQLISDLSKVRFKVNSNVKDLASIKGLISEASVSEKELKELLDSI